MERVEAEPQTDGPFPADGNEWAIGLSASEGVDSRLPALAPAIACDASTTQQLTRVEMPIRQPDTSALPGRSLFITGSTIQ